MAKEGIPFVLIMLFLALLCAFFAVQMSPLLWLGAAVFAFLALFMVYFFRDPNRTIPSDEDIIVSPADGTVTRVVKLNPENPQSEQLIGIFLSPMNVHINRAPIAGKITAVNYHKGQKLPAKREDTMHLNERNELIIEGKIRVSCTQIAGILARRIVCWKKAGDSLGLGEKFGLIKFSSRTNLILPSNVEILVREGDKVAGGETIIGRIV